MGYDFIFLGLSPAASAYWSDVSTWKATIAAEIEGTFKRLAFTGIAVVPAVNCGHVSRTSAPQQIPNDLLDGLLWGYHRTRAQAILGGCVWHYYVRTMDEDRYSDMIHCINGQGACGRKK